jgi:hypothetical protein
VKHILASIGVGTALALGVGVVVAPSAEAVAWRQTAATKANAYSWNGYKAVTKPAGFRIPSGSVKVSSTITVNRGSTTVAKNVKQARLSAGTYTVFTTTKYRTKTAYTAYRYYSKTETYADECRIESATITRPADEGSYYDDMDVAYTGTCTWSVYDDDYYSGDYMRTTTGPASWTSTEWVYEWDQTPAYSIGDTAYTIDVPGTVKWRTPYTAYKYGTVKTAHTKRTHTVTKVINTAVMTKTEYNAFGYGDSYARVARIAGSAGELRYMSGGYSLYRWRNTSGGYAYVWFDLGWWDDDAWYSG